MYAKMTEFFFCVLIVYAVAFEEWFVNGEASQEIMEQGRAQYQLLKERSGLPQYGTCWKSAVEHVNEGCRYLSEETQSDIALYLTNCFLQMSGHETYKCTDDKKPNLRAICISNMSDRAFNVYTEFYTHTQNMCWFLRGQIWHETISENTFKVGKQLETSAKNQESLLDAQRESVRLQEKIMQHGKLLEGVLEDLYMSTKAHQEILDIMTRSMSAFQSWVVGEISWFDSVLFYTASVVLIVVLTSMQRTSLARLPLLLLLFFNFLAERGIVWLFLGGDPQILNTQLVYADIVNMIWYARYFFQILQLSYFFWSTLNYVDLAVENSRILEKISRQNSEILTVLLSIKDRAFNGSPSHLNGSAKLDKFEIIKETSNGNSSSSPDNLLNNNSFSADYFSKELSSSREGSFSGSLKNSLSSFRRNYRSRYATTEVTNGRYNLRSDSVSKQNTPDPN